MKIVESIQFDEPKFWPYPKDYTLGFFNTYQEIEQLILDLTYCGMGAAIHIFQGKDRFRLIDFDGKKQFLFERLKSLSRNVWNKNKALLFGKANEEFKKGHFLVLVHTPEDQTKDCIAELLKFHGAHDIIYSNDTYIEKIK
ncbi:MAG: hypothetical protein WA160_09180 [Pseudobdellovibrio sp.]